MNLRQKGVQGAIIWIHFGDLLQSVQIREHISCLILDFLRDLVKCLSWGSRRGRVIARIDLHLVIILYLFDDSGRDLLRICTSILIQNTCHTLTLDQVGFKSCGAIVFIWDCRVARLPAILTIMKRVERVPAIVSMSLTLTQVVTRLLVLTFGPLLLIDLSLLLMHFLECVDLLGWEHRFTMMIDLSRNLLRTKCLSDEVLFGKLFVFP